MLSLKIILKTPIRLPILSLYHFIGVCAVLYCTYVLMKRLALDFMYTILILNVFNAPICCFEYNFQTSRHNDNKQFIV